MKPSPKTFRNVGLLLLAVAALVYATGAESFVLAAMQDGSTMRLVGTILTYAIRAAYIFAFAIGTALMAAHFMGLRARASRKHL